MYRKIIIFTILSLLMYSCRTTEDPTEFVSSNLPGMIYDGDNRPCERVRIKTIKLTEEGEEELFVMETDINGRFTLPGLDRGDYRIVAEKEGFETLETTISYASRTEVLYLKMFSQEQILIMAADAMEQGRFGRAESFLERSGQIDAADPRHLYSYSIYLFRTGEYENALIPLNTIIEDGYKYPWVYLLMGDIYQYHLIDKNKALESLRNFSVLVEDGDVKSRIKELEKL